jgi:hypothetical protein
MNSSDMIVLFFGEHLFVILVTILHDKCYTVSEIISALYSSLKPRPSAGAASK